MVLEVDLTDNLTFPKSWLSPLARPKNTHPPTVAVLLFLKSCASFPTELSFEDPKDDRAAAYFHTVLTPAIYSGAQVIFPKPRAIEATVSSIISGNLSSVGMSR